MNTNKDYPITSFKLAKREGDEPSLSLDGIASIDSYGTIKVDSESLQKVEYQEFFIVALNDELYLRAYLQV